MRNTCVDTTQKLPKSDTCNHEVVVIEITTYLSDCLSYTTADLTRPACSRPHGVLDEDDELP